MKRAFATTALLLSVVGCQGPAAEDPAICSDIVNRLCAEPRCAAVTSTLNVGRDCIEDLNARASCAAENFAFGEADRPSRVRMLECRLPLIRRGDAVGSAPACENVEEAFDRCSDLVRFFDGGTP